MPPEDNKLKVGIDAVFTGQKPADNTVPTSAYNVLTNQKYIPSQPQVSPVKPVINNNAPKSIVRTYKDDLANAIETSHLSSINIAIAENQKMHNQIQTGQVEGENISVTESSYSKGKVFIFIALILVAVGIIALSATYFLSKTNPTTVAPVQELPALITTEFKDELNISQVAKDKLAIILGSKINDSQITVNNLYSPYLTIGTGTERRLINATEFVSLMKFKMPDMLKRSLQPDFMVGMYNFGKNLPFVIIKTSYFENDYAGMLSWEVNLEKDFQVLFHLPGYENVGDLIAELTPTVTKKFQDFVVVNKDVRLIRDDAGQIILLYGIIDKENIIITVSDTAFKEIIDRLNKEKTLKR